MAFGEVAFVGGVHPDVPPAEIDGVVAAEVFVVEDAVDGWPVHEAVGPVEVCVVDDDHDEDGDDEVGNSEIGDMEIPVGGESQFWAECEPADGGEDEQGEKRPGEFAPVVLVLWKGWLDSPSEEMAAPDDIEDEHSEADEKEIAEEERCVDGDGEPLEVAGDLDEEVLDHLVFQIRGNGLVTEEKSPVSSEVIL